VFVGWVESRQPPADTPTTQEITMTTYAILIYGDETAFEGMAPEAFAAMLDAHNAFQAAVTQQGGTIVHGEALAPSSSATSIRLGGAPTDGPFAETKEALGGFYLIDARDLDHAISLAAMCPAPAGGVEVRPVMDTSRA
jgi:hypothetical protein